MPGQADNRAPYAKIAAHYMELISSGALQPGTCCRASRRSRRSGKSARPRQRRLSASCGTKGLSVGFTASALRCSISRRDVIGCSAAGSRAAHWF